MAAKKEPVFKRGDRVSFKQAPHGNDKQRKGKGVVKLVRRGPKGDHYQIQPDDGTPPLFVRLSALKAV